MATKKKTRKFDLNIVKTPYFKKQMKSCILIVTFGFIATQYCV